MHKYIILQNKTKKENEYVYQKFLNRTMEFVRNRAAY